MFSWEAFMKDRIAVNCTSEHQSEQFLALCEEHGLQCNRIKKSKWKTDGGGTTYSCSMNGNVFKSEKEWYLNEGYCVIPAKEICGEPILVCGTDTDRDIVIDAGSNNGNNAPDNETAAFDNTDGDCSNEPRIVELARQMAEYTRYMKLGEPTHFYCDIRAVREEVRVSGYDRTGKVYELELSITDPQKAMQ